MSIPQNEDIQLTHPSGGHLQLSLTTNEATLTNVVLYVHGFGSVRNGQKSLTVRRQCRQRGWSFAAADFRGHGESSGTLLELRGTGMQEDLDVVLTYLQSRGMEKLFLVGSSMGGFASSWFTLRHPDVVTAVCLLAPALDFAHSRWLNLSEEEQKQWQETGRLRVQNEFLDVELGYGLAEERDQFERQRLEQEWCKPLWIVHGLRDNIVPCNTSIDFVHRARHREIELLLLKDGDHRLERHRHQIAEQALNFFSRWL